MSGPLPDLHKAISIFKIQFAGVTTCSPLPHIQIEFLKFRLQVNFYAVHSQISIRQFQFLKFSLQVLQLLTTSRIQKELSKKPFAGSLLRSPFSELLKEILIFEIQLAGITKYYPLPEIQKEFSKISFQVMFRDPFPEIHNSILLLEIQFGGVTNCSTLPDI